MSIPISLYPRTIATNTLKILTALLVLPVPLTLFINLHLHGTITYEISPIGTLIINFIQLQEQLELRLKDALTDHSRRSSKCHI